MAPKRGGVVRLTPKTVAVRSMTGFGHASLNHLDFSVSCEISSLNHRYFDLHYYAPPYLMKFEANLRRRVQSLVPRGRVRLAVHVTGSTEPGQRVRFCEENAREYLRGLEELEKMTGKTAELSLMQLVTAPNVLVPSRDEFSADEWQPVVEKLVESAVAQMNDMRVTEGASLANDLQSRVATLSTRLGTISERVPAVREEQRQRLLERLREWELDGKFTEDRLQTEVVLVCERSDITEEIVRMQSHLGQFQDSLDQGGTIGRRLVFLVQELHREISTIGAKSNDAAIGREVVFSKEEISKVREQSENVE